MNVSFKGAFLIKFSDACQRDNIKRLEKTSTNGNGNFWKSFKINEKDSSDLLILTGLDLEEAIEKAGGTKNLDSFVKSNKEIYLKISNIKDCRTSERENNEN